MADLVERLREVKVPVTSFGTITGWTTHPVTHEAANRITALEAEIARKDEALRAARRFAYEAAGSLSRVGLAIPAYLAKDTYLTIDDALAALETQHEP